MRTPLTTHPPTNPPAPWGECSEPVLLQRDQNPSALRSTRDAPRGSCPPALSPLCWGQDTILLLMYPLPSGCGCAAHGVGAVAWGGGQEQPPGTQGRHGLRADLYIYLQQGGSRAGLWHQSGPHKPCTLPRGTSPKPLHLLQPVGLGAGASPPTERARAALEQTRSPSLGWGSATTKTKAGGQGEPGTPHQPPIPSCSRQDWKLQSLGDAHPPAAPRGARERRRRLPQPRQSRGAPRAVWGSWRPQPGSSCALVVGAGAMLGGARSSCSAFGCLTHLDLVGTVKQRLCFSPAGRAEGQGGQEEHKASFFPRWLPAEDAAGSMLTASSLPVQAAARGQLPSRTPGRPGRRRISPGFGAKAPG